MKYGLPSGGFDCPKCHARFFKPAGCRIKKCDKCKAKWIFEEYEVTHALTRMTTQKSRILKEMA